VPEVLGSEAVAVTFAERVFGYFAFLVPIFVAMSTFGGVNGILLTSSRYKIYEKIVIIKKWELAFSYVFHHCTTLLSRRTLDFELRNANFCYFKAQPFKVICVQVFFDCFENNKVHNLQFAF
jgi:hypothetical protein